MGKCGDAVSAISALFLQTSRIAASGEKLVLRIVRQIGLGELSNTLARSRLASTHLADQL